MSCGSLVKCKNGSTYVSNVVVNSYHELQERIKSEQEWINKLQSRLRQLAACTPKDVFPQNKEEDPLWRLNHEFDDIWESVECAYDTLTQLRILESVVDDWKYACDDPLDISIKENWDSIVVVD